MRIPSYMHQNLNQERPAMTSMIDVVFLLLIFFICASVGMTREDLLSTLLSSGDSSSVLEQVDQPLGEVWVKIRLTESGQPAMMLEGREFDDFDALRETLSQLADVAPEIPVILDIASEVRMEDVIHLYDICVQAKFQSIHFATRTSQPKKPKSVTGKSQN